MRTRIIIDTNVLVSALKSRRGASFALLTQVGTNRFDHIVTVPLVMEYESVLLRPNLIPLSADSIGDVIDYLCATGIDQTIHFLWRPKLPDPKDDMVLEAAVNGACSIIVTHNLRDFAPAIDLGVQPMSPADFITFLNQEST